MNNSEFELPEWKGSPYSLWAKNFCYRNQWRARHILGDYDDCYAQCCLWYYECWKFYQGKVQTASHFMVMYKLWVVGQFNDLSTKDTKKREVVQYRTEPTTTSEGDLTVKLGEASSELKEVLNIMFNAPQEILETLRADCQSYCPKQFFKKIVTYLGKDPAKTPKLAKELQDLLS